MGLEVFRSQKGDEKRINTDQIENDIDKSDWCAPHRYAVPMNEACGGCEGCLKMQAEFYGYDCQYDIGEEV